jgi:hypothetical protein
VVLKSHINVRGFTDQVAVLMAAQRGWLKKTISQQVGQSAQSLRRKMMTGLRNQKPGGKPILPISPMTMLLRKFKAGESAYAVPTKSSTKALIVDGDLLRSINVRKLHDFKFTVGVHRGTATKNGKDIVNLAALHEGGSSEYTITVTEKMQRFSYVLKKQKIIDGIWVAGTTIKRQTPARPFLRPAWDVWVKKIPDEHNKRLTKALRRKLARELKKGAKKRIGLK